MNMLRKSQNQTRLLLHNCVKLSRALATSNKPASKVEKVKPSMEESSYDVPEQEEPTSASFLMRNLGSSHRTWTVALEKHPELMTVKRKDILNSYKALTTMHYTVKDILTKPMVMYYNATTLTNRHSVLLECGFQNINISTLAKYITVINRPINLLKTHHYIPYDVNVAKRLTECFTDIVLPRDLYESVDENVTLKSLRQTLVNEYLRHRLQMDDNDIQKLWRVYARVRHKSFRALQDVIEILIKEFKFNEERIVKNSFLLHAEGDNIRRILKDIPTINDQDIREIGYRRPKILMSSCDNLRQTIEHVRAFGISEDAILRCLEVLTLGPDTVFERLRDLNKIEEFQVLGTNPRVLRLVHYQNKARLRLDYLNQLKVRCASLHILSCGSGAFVKFARDGSDRTKGKDILVYLSKLLLKDAQELRQLLNRHPNWCHIPLLHVKQCLEYLLSKKFNVEEIFHNIHLLLYPIKRIEEKLLLLQTPAYLEELELQTTDINSLQNNEILTLILYLIELEFHFTGDGIWTEQHTHNVENFNNLLPDFPESVNKVYKYGTKPSQKLPLQTS